MNRLAFCLLCFGAFLNVPSAGAQSTPGTLTDSVELAPALLSGGSTAIVAAVQRRLVYPLPARHDRVAGRVFVTFTVTPTGLVRGHGC